VHDRRGLPGDTSLDGGAAALPGTLTPATPAPAGPGFFELGEELSVARTASGLMSAVVVAGRDGAVLDSGIWTIR